MAGRTGVLRAGVCHTPSSSAGELSYASVSIFIFFYCMDLQVAVGVSGCALSALIAIQSSLGVWGLLPADICLPADYPIMSPAPVYPSSGGQLGAVCGM